MKEDAKMEIIPEERKHAVIWKGGRRIENVGAREKATCVHLKTNSIYNRPHTGGKHTRTRTHTDAHMHTHTRGKNKKHLQFLRLPSSLKESCIVFSSQENWNVLRTRKFNKKKNAL